MNETKIAIVTGTGREEEYANKLFQIIGKFPDFESSFPITESEYNVSFTTIKGKIIFFGNCKEVENQGKAVEWIYDRFGMRYGWRGNRCVITASANELIDAKKKQEFIDYYNSKIKEFNSLKNDPNLLLPKYSEIGNSEINGMIDDITWKESDDTGDKIAKTMTAIIGAPLLLIVGSINAAESVDIWRRQYELLICEFIINGFSAFMRNASEKVFNKLAVIVYHDWYVEYAHLLTNLIQQHYGYDAVEYTEKMFIDNKKKLSGKNKIIFLGDTQTAKKFMNNDNRNRFNEIGVHYGWFGNQAFIGLDPVYPGDRDGREKFMQLYRQKRGEYADKSHEYDKRHNNSEYAENKTTKKSEASTLQLQFRMLFQLPDISDNVGDLTYHQYNLLLREFVITGLEEFMEE